MPGDEVKLQGDYMDPVMSVTFEGGALSKKHIDRHNVSVIIPSSAITGKIALQMKVKLQISSILRTKFR